METNKYELYIRLAAIVAPIGISWMKAHTDIITKYAKNKEDSKREVNMFFTDILNCLAVIYLICNLFWLVAVQHFDSWTVLGIISSSFALYQFYLIRISKRMMTGFDEFLTINEKIISLVSKIQDGQADDISERKKEMEVLNELVKRLKKAKIIQGRTSRGI